MNFSTHAPFNLAMKLPYQRPAIQEYDIYAMPACGGCMVTERTDDHARFFDEGRDALFFDTPESLLRQARTLADDDGRRHEIAMSGHRRVVRDGHTYGTRLEALFLAV